MDIDYLLWLQGIREALPDVATDIAVAISDVAGAGIVTMLVPFFVYWIISRNHGLAILLAFGLSNMAGQLAKAIFCVFRPWVLDARVQPAEAALGHATGYSFPSGHVLSATSSYGGTAFHERHGHWLVSAALFLLTALVAFTRNFLGVHTPQDVLVGIGIGIAGIIVASLVARALEGVGPVGQLVTVCLAFAAVAAFLAFVTLKQYPDGRVNGILEASPYEMKVDCYKSAGFFAGLALGWLLERIFVDGFEAATTVAEGVARLALALVLIAATYLGAGHALIAISGELWGEFARSGLSAIVGIAIIPAFFPSIARRLGAAEAVPAEEA